MSTELINISLKKLDAYRESSLDIPSEINVNFNISLIDFKVLDEENIIIKSGFTLNISDISSISAQLDVSIKVDSVSEFSSNWKASTEKKLEDFSRINIEKGIFYYMMPLSLSLAEKMNVPLPIPSPFG